MSGSEFDDQTIDARIASLVRFGFSEQAITDFLAEHEEAYDERLLWLENRRETATEIEERLEALTRFAPATTVLQDYASRLDDPFTVEEMFDDFEREVRAVFPWEPVLVLHKAAWFEQGEGDVWQSLFEQLARLDVSSHAALTPLYRLFAMPERADEIVRHMKTIEHDESRQRNMIEGAAERLRNEGYPVGDLSVRPLLDGLKQLEQWQLFHAERERVRLNALQLIQPFDEGLAATFEERCLTLHNVEELEELKALAEEVQGVAQSLEQRRKALSDTIQEWRALGIVFPHSGELHPNDLMEWETNHDEVAAKVSQHLKLVERWNRFQRYWPSRTEASRELIGRLDDTDRLRDAVDSLDALWKKLELDGLEFLQAFEHAGLDVGGWRNRVFEDPMNALEQMTREQHRWEARVALIDELQALDVSFEGEEEVVLRTQLLATEEAGDDVLGEMQRYVERMRLRNARHREMLEEELASMRRAGVLEREVSIEGMNLKDLEAHVIRLTRSGGADVSPGEEGFIGAKIRKPVMKELAQLNQMGWQVDDWMGRVKDDPVGVARELSEARPHVQNHEVLRRRLSALPWNRDVALALEVELLSKDPQRLEYLSQRIPSYTAHLAGREVEEEAYALALWRPPNDRPTLVPVPELMERTVLQPASPLEDAHEAMLEAMDTGLEEPVANAPEEVLSEVMEPNQEDAGVEHGTESKAPVEPDGTVLLSEQKEVPTRTENEPVEAAPPKRAAGSDAATKKALEALSELVALLGLTETSTTVDAKGLVALPEVRRALASQVNVSPRDVRIGRLLRLALRLLPAEDGLDEERARMLATLCQMVPPLKRWMRRRLEARHSGASGDFLEDASELGVALQRIPGLGKHVPLNVDEWPLPSDVKDLRTEVEKLGRSVNLPSAGGVKA